MLSVPASGNYCLSVASRSARKPLDKSLPSLALPATHSAAAAGAKYVSTV